MNHKKSQQGLTIIEVIVGILLITIISTASITGLMRLSKILNSSQKSIETNTVSQALIETVQNQWRTHAYRPNPDGNATLNAENVEVWIQNVRARELYDRNCLVLDKLSNSQLELFSTYGSTVKLEAIDRDFNPRGNPVIYTGDTYEDCINLDYNSDEARQIFVKRFSVVLDPNNPSSFENISFDLGKPNISCPNDDPSDCANAGI